MKKSLKNIHLHKHNQIIYGDTDPDAVLELADHMNRVGQITPIVVNKGSTVISGARRVAAARLLKWKSIEVVVKDIPKDQEIFYIIQANHQRQKTMVQLCNEIDVLWDYYQSSKTNGRPRKGAAVTHPKGKTRDLVAADLGVSNKQIQQLRYVKKARPDLLPHIGPSMTLQACYSQVRLFCNQEHVLRAKANGKDPVDLSGFDFQLYTKSSADMSELEDDSIDHIVTSPPYFSQRQFAAIQGDGSVRELGQEKTVGEYVESLLVIMKECKRVLRPTGSLMLNLDDTYHQKTKLQMPERVSIAMQDRLGLVLRNVLIQSKGGSMTPESTKRRRHSDFEFIYHFVIDADKYFYDADMIRVPYVTDVVCDSKPPRHHPHEVSKGVNARWVNQAKNGKVKEPISFSNVSSSIRHPLGKIPGCVLDIARHTNSLDVEGGEECYHTAPFSDRLVRELLKPIAQPGDILLDPFSGSGTVGAVAAEFGAYYIGYDTNENFNRIAAKRLHALQLAD